MEPPAEGGWAAATMVALFLAPYSPALLAGLLCLLQLTLHVKLQAAYGRPTYAATQAALARCRRELRLLNESAVKSLDEVPRPVLSPTGPGDAIHADQWQPRPPAHIGAAAQPRAMWSDRTSPCGCIRRFTRLTNALARSWRT